MSTLNTYNLKSPDSANTNIELDASGNIAVRAGSAASPSIYVTGDSNTGIYSPGADQVAISTNGTGRLFVDASGNIECRSYASIGTLAFANANGTEASPTALSTPQLIMNLVARGYDGSAYRQIAAVRAYNDGAVSSTSSPGFLALSTTPSGSTTAQERLRITSAGLVGVGTSSPSNTLHVVGTGRFINGSNPLIIATDGGDPYIYTESAAGLKLGTNSAVRMTINSSGNVGVGTTSPGRSLEVSSSTSDTRIAITNSTTGGGVAKGLELIQAAQDAYVFGYGTGSLIFGANSTERSRIDSSGRFLVGTSSARSNIAGFSQTVQIEGTTAATSSLALIRNQDANTPASNIYLAKSRSGSTGGNTIVQSNDSIGYVNFSGNDGANFITAALIGAEVDGTPGTLDMPGRLVFSTTADGASSPTERMRIGSAGDITFGTTSVSPAQSNFAGVAIEGSTRAGTISCCRDSFTPLFVARKSNDGELVGFLQDGTQEGSISVSGTTVSYNGAHLSRWSQLPSGAKRTEILRGTVLSNIDEMCEWGDEDNEQLNRMKVSDVEGDKNVSGVFQAWDDDDDTYTNDFYCAMTGDFIIRIGAGSTVERGDLLMSAGDGTAKPQDDDIIRSKTIAKVTSTNVSCTYDDGSYCVPCVLMAC